MINKINKSNIIETQKINMLQKKFEAHETKINNIKKNEVNNDIKITDLNYNLDPNNKIDSIIIDLDNIKAKAQENTKINTDGKYENLTEYQKILLSNLWYFDDSPIPDYWLESDGTINKTIDQLYIITKIHQQNPQSSDKEKEDAKRIIDYLTPLIEQGFSDFKIVEVKNEKEKPTGKIINKKQETKIDTFDCVVLQDINKNYILHYNCTNAGEITDLIYDADALLKMDQNTQAMALNAYKKRIQNKIQSTHLSALDQILNNDKDTNIFEKGFNHWLSGATSLTNYAIDNVDTKGIINTFSPITDLIKKFSSAINDDQKNDAYEMAEKYYQKAEQENKQLNIHAYSLGGSLAEYSYLKLLENHGDTKTLNKITLFNPYHNNLSEEEVQTLIDHDLELYCNEGDIVSAVFNQQDFDQKSNEDWSPHYIYIDYNNIINERINEYTKEDLENTLEETIIFDIGISHLHSIEAASISTNIDEYGNVQKNIKVNNEDYTPHAINNNDIYNAICQKIDKTKRENNYAD